VSEEPRSVLEAVQLLEAEGFGGSFVLGPHGLRCTECGSECRADVAEVVRVYRFEGPSDPDEEAVVYALRCPGCTTGGTLVSAFGPGADPELTDSLVMLEERFRQSNS
jgi:hypothetical protein